MNTIAGECHNNNNNNQKRRGMVWDGVLNSIRLISIVNYVFTFLEEPQWVSRESSYCFKKNNLISEIMVRETDSHIHYSILSNMVKETTTTTMESDWIESPLSRSRNDFAFCVWQFFFSSLTTFGRSVVSFSRVAGNHRGGGTKKGHNYLN